jgi:hypothetical protein
VLEQLAGIVQAIAGDLLEQVASIFLLLPFLGEQRDNCLPL